MSNLDFDPGQPLSHYTIGNSNGTPHIFILHGVRERADWHCDNAEKLQRLFPGSAITVINGLCPVPTKKDSSAKPRFGWSASPNIFDQSNYDEASDKVADIIRSFKVPPDKVVVFGFSQGGFVAADIIRKHSDVARHALLHTSLLLDSPTVHNLYGMTRNLTTPKTSIDTVISVNDQYFFRDVVSRLPMQFRNSWAIKNGGNKSRTHISWGFGHEITDASLKLSARIIKSRLGQLAA